MKSTKLRNSIITLIVVAVTMLAIGSFIVYKMNNETDIKITVKKIIGGGFSNTLVEQKQESKIFNVGDSRSFAFGSVAGGITVRLAEKTAAGVKVSIFEDGAEKTAAVSYGNSYRYESSGSESGFDTDGPIAIYWVTPTKTAWSVFK